MHYFILFVVAFFFSLSNLGCNQANRNAPVQVSKFKDSPPTAIDLENAFVLELAPGEVSSEEGEILSVEESIEPISVSYQNQSRPQISQGASIWTTFSLAEGENVDIRTFPTMGDVDIRLWKGTTLLKSSLRAAGYADNITTAPYMSGVAGNYSIEFRCFSGPCQFRTTISVGNNTTFQQGSHTYVNQLSFNTTTVSDTVTCKSNSGATLNDGECMCSDASAANALTDMGRAKMSDARMVAADLYNNTNFAASGAGNRDKLMARLKSNYNYSICFEDTNLANLRAHVRSGYLVLFRSASFSGAGHYVTVRGFFDNGNTILVDDPYGKWSGYGAWSPRNTTEQTSINGRAQLYNLASLSWGASLIVCF